MRPETASEKAIEHPVWEEPGKADDHRRVAANGVVGARPFAGDRVRDNGA